MNMRTGWIVGLTAICVASTAQAEPRGLFGGYACSYGLKKTGCDTSYVEAVSAMRLDETTVRISAKGNGYTRSDDVFRYALRKAAEETLAAGYDLFTIAMAQDTTTQQTRVTGGDSIGGDGYGPRITTPVRGTTIIRPGQAVVVKLSRGAKPAEAPVDLYDAREVLKFMSARP